MVKSTTQVGREFEESIAKLFKFDKSRRSPSSGAKFYDNIDVTTEHFVIEAEATAKASKSLKLEFWREVREKAYNNKKPLLAFRFITDKRPVDLIAMDINDFVELIEELYERN